MYGGFSLQRAADQPPQTNTLSLHDRRCKNKRTILLHTCILQEPCKFLCILIKFSQVVWCATCKIASLSRHKNVSRVQKTSSLQLTKASACLPAQTTEDISHLSAAALGHITQPLPLVIHTLQQLLPANRRRLLRLPFPLLHPLPHTVKIRQHRQILFPHPNPSISYFTI